MAIKKVYPINKYDPHSLKDGIDERIRTTFRQDRPAGQY